MFLVVGEYVSSAHVGVVEPELVADLSKGCRPDTVSSIRDKRVEIVADILVDAIGAAFEVFNGEKTSSLRSSRAADDVSPPKTIQFRDHLRPLPPPRRK